MYMYVYVCIKVYLGFVILLMFCNCWEQPWFYRFFPETDADLNRVPRGLLTLCFGADLSKLWRGLYHLCMAGIRQNQLLAGSTKEHD